jgi:hypothetical protein
MAKRSSSRTLAFAFIICGGIMQFVSIVVMIVQSVLYPLGPFLAGTASFISGFIALRRARIDGNGLT